MCRWIAAGIVVAGLVAAADAGPEKLSYVHVSIPLPGAPSKIVPADLDGDGLQDLLVIVVYTEYEGLSFDRIEGFVQLTEVVPALTEKREMRAYLAGPRGVYRLAGDPLEMPAGLAAVTQGPPPLSALALTSSGVARIALAGTGADRKLELRPLIAEPSVLQGSDSFLPSLDLVADLDGEGVPDLLFPGREGPEVYLGAERGFANPPASRLHLPGDARGGGVSAWRVYPIPSARDLNGDGRPDLILPSDGGGPGATVLEGAGGGRFGEPRRIEARCLHPKDAGNTKLAYLGDLDGRGPGELVTRTGLETGDEGMKEAKNPRYVYRFYRLRKDLSVQPAPYQELEVEGYPYGGELTGRGSEQFTDLDGDSRRDMVTVTLDFSFFQVIRALATKRIGIGLEFNVWRQGGEGRFERVKDLHLSDKILLDLNNLRLDRLGNFSGDFDGDGRREFLAYEGGRKVRMHHGAPGCAYSKKPDLEMDLDEAPQDPGLVRILDLDGDGVSDLAVTRLGQSVAPGASPPTSLDLYLSGGERR